MSDSEKEKKEMQSGILKAVGIGLGIPSSILGVFFFVYYLIQEGHIADWVGMLIIVVIVGYLFYLMVRNVYQKK